MRGSMGKEKLRLLGNLELYHHTRSRLRFYNAVALTAQYTIPSQALKDFGGLQSAVFAVLKTVICRHPIMGVSVMEETPRAASWVRLSSIDLQKVTTFIAISGGQQFLEDEHQKPIEGLGELPLWRVVIAEIQSDADGLSTIETVDESLGDTVFEVGFFYSHALGDGLSGAAFHLDFLDALNALGAENHPTKTEPESLVEIPKLELLPNLEKAAHFPLSITYVGWQIIKAFILGDKDSKRWTGSPVVFSPETPPKTRMSTIIIPNSLLVKISASCRKNGVTVTPLLVVLIARHLASAYPSYSRFLATIAIQLRRFTGASNRQMVNHVSGVIVPFSTTGETGYVSCGLVDWEVIRRCRRIIDCSAKSPSNQLTILLKFLSDFEGFLKSKIGKDRDRSFELSNVGLVDGGVNAGGIAKFRRLVFSQPANVSESPYIFSVASVKGGDMTIALTWQEGILEEVKAKKVMEDLNDEIHRMGMESDLEDLNNNHNK